MSISCAIAAAQAFTAPPLLPARPRLRPLRVVASAGPPPYEEAKKGFYVRPSAAVERGGAAVKLLPRDAARVVGVEKAPRLQLLRVAQRLAVDVGGDVAKRLEERPLAHLVGPRARRAAERLERGLEVRVERAERWRGRFFLRAVRRERRERVGGGVGRGGVCGRRVGVDDGARGRGGGLLLAGSGGGGHRCSSRVCPFFAVRGNFSREWTVRSRAR